jgi:hypothetical protein
VSDRLQLDDIAGLLKTDATAVRNLFETGRLHGVREGDSWITTPEMLEGDLELLTEMARIDRLRTGAVPVPPEKKDRHAWLTTEWVDAALAQLRAP